MIRASRAGLAGKTALITGASRGLGARIAAALDSEGMNLILVARTSAGLKHVAEDLGKHCNRIEILAADLSDRQVVETLIGDAIARIGQIDILINNAAISGFLPYHCYRLEDLERQIFINLMAPLLLTRQILPHMLAIGQGHLINISSLSADIPVAYMATYAAAKAGLASFTRSLRQELVGTGVRATVIMPGVVRDIGLINDFERRSGFVTARAAGGCISDQVTSGVICALRNDYPDVVINSPPIRPLLALSRLMPRATERLLRLMGIQDAANSAVMKNLAAGGKLTGTEMVPDQDAPRESGAAEGIGRMSP